MSTRQVVTKTALEGLSCHRGKVRDNYDLDDTLLMVSTDRISAFDRVLPTGIPSKGIVLNQLSLFWPQELGVPYHLCADHQIGINVAVKRKRSRSLTPTEWQLLAHRSMLVKNCRVIPIECVVRGYLAGSGWKEYRKHGTVCQVSLPDNLKQCDQLPQPIFTPATKATTGHDENINFARMCLIVGQFLGDDSQGQQLSQLLRAKSLQLYQEASELARGRGIIIADTKFEWGLDNNGEPILIDEVLTPDSSRFWPVDEYEPGRGQPQLDKQIVRDWLEQSDWDKNSPPPTLPDHIVEQTRAKYIEVYELLTERDFPFK